MGDIAISREEKIFVKASTTQAQNVTAFVATDITYFKGEADFTQQINTFPNEEKRNSRTRLKPLYERYPPGSWSYSTYLKNSGTTLLSPESADLWKALLGVQVTKATTKTKYHVTSFPSTTTTFYITNHGTTRTNTALLLLKGPSTGDNWEVVWVVSMAAASAHGGSTHRKIRVEPALGTAIVASGTTCIGSVVFSPIATTPNAVAHLISRGHSVFRYTGCSVNEAEINVSGEGFSDVNWTGEYMREYRTGTDALASAIGANTTSQMKVAGSALRFDQGSIFKIDSEIMYVRDIQSTTATTVVTGIRRGTKSSVITNHANAAVINPWTPVTSVVASAGTPIAGYRGTIDVNSTSLVILSAQINVNNNTKMAVGEKDSNKYVQSFSNPGFREISARLTTYFRKANLQHFRLANEARVKSFTIPVGNPEDGKGKLVSIRFNNAVLGTPDLSGDEEIQSDIEVTAFGSASQDNDEMFIAFL